MKCKSIQVRTSTSSTMMVQYLHVPEDGEDQLTLIILKLTTPKTGRDFQYERTERRLTCENYKHKMTMCVTQMKCRVSFLY